MAKLFYVIAALCALQLVAGNAVPAKTTLAEDIEHSLSVMHTKFLSLWDVKDDTELTNKVIDQGKTFSTKLGVIADELTEKVKSSSGPVQEATAEYVANLKTKIEQLKEDHPEVDTYKTKLEGLFADIVTETKKISKKFEDAGVTDEINNSVKKVFDSTREVAEGVVTTVEKKIKE